MQPGHKINCKTHLTFKNMYKEKTKDENWLLKLKG